jgi:predicted nucleotidyltransferase/DNA-binding XRE family transcriptional regulator
VQGVSELIREARAGAGLTQRELATRAGTSQPAIARYERGTALPTLATLERLLLACGRRPIVGAVAAEAVPARRGALRAAAEPRATLLRRRRRRLLEAARRRGARDVRVFGSIVRGDEHPSSDVDLLVVLEQGRTLLDLAAFRREAAEILGVPVDVATPDMLKERIRAEVLAEAVPL